MNEPGHPFLPPQRLWRALPIFLYCFLLGALPTFANETIFTYRVGESALDVRQNYETEALKLALEKTKLKWGSYRLEPSPPMNARRSIVAASSNEYPNLVILRSYRSDVERQNLIFVRFPVDLGILGYRVCFISPQAKEKIKDVSNLDDLRKFTIGQGSDWTDVEILRRNGFKVIDTSNYESLFRMVSANRFDLFCRGANELYEELEERPNLIYDETMSIAYPKPALFHTHESNRKAAERIEEGLKQAYRDGSLQKLWRKYYMKSIDFVKLNKRKIFWLDNPFLDDLDFNYRQYTYDPLSPTESHRHLSGK